MLHHAHSEAEQIDIPDLIASTQFLAYYILKQTGTIV
jgi:acetylornithine deacetylase/succinyl-diaminopimelate desuccinylase-like protein